MSCADSVKVAVRIRPQSSREQGLHQICTVASETDPQVYIGSEKSFVYDHVFDQNSTQESVYNSCVKDLVDGIFGGLNATILAYGQTGSGKTHTIGTAFGSEVIQPESLGVIPRAVEQIFETILSLKKQTNESDGFEPMFTINVQFIELYNEEFIDLLSPDRSSNIKIQESPDTGEIIIKNATTISVSSSAEILEVLCTGARGRATASTSMNQQSSRSHAIFSIHIKQEKLEIVAGEQIPITLTAKLHFVDLAGSERLKRTKAVGDRAKEGININYGLLILGNVISALTDPKKTHVPYRDSKLTRLLQDSLGGNSRTLMIACASPNDSDYAETLNTLTYASRAKEIKNQIRVNKDSGSSLVVQLQIRIAELESELETYHQEESNQTPRKKRKIEMDLSATYKKMTESLFNEFKRRVDQALGNKPVLDSLVIDQQKTIRMINEFGERLGSHLEILQLPSHSKGPRKIKDKINFKVIEVVPEELDPEDEKKIIALQRELATYKRHTEELEIECKIDKEKFGEAISQLKQAINSLKQELLDTIGSDSY